MLDALQWARGPVAFLGESQLCGRVVFRNCAYVQVSSGSVVDISFCFSFPQGRRWVQGSSLLRKRAAKRVLCLVRVHSQRAAMIKCPRSRKSVGHFWKVRACPRTDSGNLTRTQKHFPFSTCARASSEAGSQPPDSADHDRNEFRTCDTSVWTRVPTPKLATPGEVQILSPSSANTRSPHSYSVFVYFWLSLPELHSTISRSIKRTFLRRSGAASTGVGASDGPIPAGTLVLLAVRLCNLQKATQSHCAAVAVQLPTSG